MKHPKIDEWLRVVNGSSNGPIEFTDAERVMWANTHAAFGNYDLAADNWVGCVCIQTVLITQCRDFIRKKREAEPPQWAKILRKKLSDEFPELPSDLVEAFVTIGLWNKCLLPSSAKTATPVFDGRHVTADLARLIISTNALYRAEQCSGTIKKRGSPEPKSS